eukprot:PhM_4_TR14152/c0_g1_i1/m.51544
MRSTMRSLKASTHTKRDGSDGKGSAGGAGIVPVGFWRRSESFERARAAACVQYSSTDISMSSIRNFSSMLSALSMPACCSLPTKDIACCCAVGCWGASLPWVWVSCCCNLRRQICSHSLKYPRTCPRRSLSVMNVGIRTRIDWLSSPACSGARDGVAGPCGGVACGCAWALGCAVCAWRPRAWAAIFSSASSVFLRSFWEASFSSTRQRCTIVPANSTTERPPSWERVCVRWVSSCEMSMRRRRMKFTVMSLNCQRRSWLRRRRVSSGTTPRRAVSRSRALWRTSRYVSLTRESTGFWRC